MNKCDDCLYHNTELIYNDNNMNCFPYSVCHHDNGKYNSLVHVPIDTIFVEDCPYYRKDIRGNLHDLEKEYDITILYAVESGSRAWGFHNLDSDYDIRFIYKHNNLKEYLTLGKPKEVITINDGVYDIVGWDVRKSLWLHYKNNPSLREWLNTDNENIYIFDYKDTFADLPSFEKGVLMHHYSSMAWNNWNDFCEGYYNWVGTEDEPRLLKKYLYVLRCIITFKILEQDNMAEHSPELPIHIIRLIQYYQLFYSDETVKDWVYQLILRYKGFENNLNNKMVDDIKEFIMFSMKDMKEKVKHVEIKSKDLKVYNERFHDIVTGDYYDS